MKTKTIIVILITLLLMCCKIGKKQSVRKPFKPVLENIIIELLDSLNKTERDNKLLAIQFFNFNDYDIGCNMRIFVSDWYASGSIEGYTKIGNTTIAIYNIKDDFYELVNKNAITFFTDTLIGFRDVGIWVTSESDIILPQFCYIIHTNDSISRILSKKTFGSFPYANLIRMPKWMGISYTPLEEECFYYDSIQTEEKLEFYKKEVEYYRNKKKNEK